MGNWALKADVHYSPGMRSASSVGHRCACSAGGSLACALLMDVLAQVAEVVRHPAGEDRRRAEARGVEPQAGRGGQR